MSDCEKCAGLRTKAWQLQKAVDARSERIKNMAACQERLQRENAVLRAKLEQAKMTSQAVKHKMCGKKKTYHTKAKAEGALVKFGGRIYECPICFCWHHTTKEKRDE